MDDARQWDRKFDTYDVFEQSDPRLQSALDRNRPLLHYLRDNDQGISLPVITDDMEVSLQISIKPEGDFRGDHKD